MDQNGVISKLVYSNTENSIQTKVEIRYNTHTNHIGIHTGFQKSPGSNNGSVNNKNCSNYLGITIAEQLLSKIFKYVERMPYRNRGFDFKCAHGYMIDVKSSTKMKTQNAWFFNIHQNQIADYFLCLAFDNRKNLNPMHIWLIPSRKINNLKTLTISESRIDKWSKYELGDKLNKVITCCNIMRET